MRIMLAWRNEGKGKNDDKNKKTGKGIWKTGWKEMNFLHWISRMNEVGDG